MPHDTIITQQNIRSMRISATLLTIIAAIATLTATAATQQPTIGVTPTPNNLTYAEETTSLDITAGLKLYISCDNSDTERLMRAVERTGIATKRVKRPARNAYLNLIIRENSTASDEAYDMTVTEQGVEIVAPTAAGLFYGVQTLEQLNNNGCIAACHISDAPRLKYRGILIDISRHFRTAEFLKRQIDIMAQLKMNRLHLHLTDAAGWRLEIESYPRLTSYAAWRTPATWKEWWYGERAHVNEGDAGAYGGYLTKAEARDLVAYAADRYITIIPEIEMPGHSDEVLAAYPELKCSHQPERQGDLCIGKEATFEMMQSILDEVMEIFPSEYIHIGGDEAGKQEWSKCEDCQRRIKEEGLNGVDELQSYMIHRIEEYLNSHNRQIIGWDEILQGGLAPNATVMSWRGEEGGITAANMGHDVIMSPHGYCYIDAPQDAPCTEPESIGGYLPLERVYSYDPAPKSLDESVRRHIIGVQANLWAEFIPTDEHYEYMLWPRAVAVAEIGWTHPDMKNYASFRERAIAIVDNMLKRGYHPFDLKNEKGNRPESLQPISHLAVGKSVTYNAPSRYYAPKYAAAGDATLTDGLRGTWTYADNRWQGFLGRGGVDVTIDMGEVTEIHSVAADFMQICSPGVFMPCKVIISVSTDGVEYTTLTTIDHEVVVDELPSFKSFGWEGVAEARYIRYNAHRSKFSGFLFVDEIVVQ